ncbi:MAG TPA: TonB family protein [Thermodesulfovibrionales bacterium]|nr:TonB family protein [Thermodesulfovibrionales bacterium]
MSAVSLQRSAILASVLHVSLFGIALILMRQSNHFAMPSPYTVNLVSPGAATPTAGSATPTAVKTPVADRAVKRPVPLKQPEVTKAPSKQDEQLLEDRIAALREMGKIKRIAKLRGIISVKTGKEEAKIGPSTEAAGQPRGSLTEDYAARVGEEIHRQWQFPTQLLKDRRIEAIVSIRILKNGSLQIIGIEKSSGNPLFDRSGLRAITQASPVTPPPYEMEIGVRFFPGD